MASQRRRGSGGSGFRTPEIRGTLGTLIRSALAQADTVRGALERGAREGRSRLDSFRSSQRRNDALIELGEIVLDLVRRGEIDAAELPEARDVLRFLDEVDEGAEDRDVAQPPTRSRFDTRSRERDDDGTTSSRTWSPPKPAKPEARVWRPVVDEAPEAPVAPAAKHKPLARKGGISFDDNDDDDLADYMHPDDVPPKSDD